MEPGAQGQGHHPDQQVAGGGHRRRGQQAVAPDQDEPRRYRAQDGAEGVGGVEHTGGAVQVVRPQQRGLDHQRQGGPHQRRRQQHDGEGQSQPDQRAEVTRIFVEPRRQPAIDVRQGGECPRRQQPQGPDPQLDHPVHQQRAPDAVGRAPGAEATQGQAGHKAGQHGGDGAGGDAEGEAQQAHPEHLVDQAARRPRRRPATRAPRVATTRYAPPARDAQERPSAPRPPPPPGSPPLLQVASWLPRCCPTRRYNASLNASLNAHGRIETGPRLGLEGD